MADTDPELTRAFKSALDRLEHQRIDIVTLKDIGLGPLPERSKIIEGYAGYFNRPQDTTTEGNTVEPLVKETDMTGPTGLKYGNATNVQFSVDDGVTRLVYDAGGRRHSIVKGNGEYTSMSIPLEALESLKGLKGVNFKDSSDKEPQAVPGSAIKEAVAHVALNSVGRFGLNAAVELITESIPCSEWARIDWKRIMRQHSDLTVQAFIDAMNDKVEYLQGYNVALTVAQALSVTLLVDGIEHWLETRGISAHEVYQATVNPEAAVEEFLTAIAPPGSWIADLEALISRPNPPNVQFIEGGNLIEDPVAPVETAKTLRKELMGKLNLIRNAAYRTLFIEQHLSEDHLFALEKQYVIARSYLKKQLRKELLDTDSTDNIFLDVAQFGTFRVLRMNDEADWTLIAGVAFKDYNWVITQ